MFYRIHNMGRMFLVSTQLSDTNIDVVIVAGFVVVISNAVAIVVAMFVHRFPFFTTILVT